MSTAIITVDGGTKGLLPARRVSNTYDAHVQASTQGEASVRILALAAGVGMVACALTVWIHWIVNHRFSWLEFVISITSLVVGVLAFTLECNISFVEPTRAKITTKAPIFGQAKGRGSMYAAAGLIQCAMLDPLDIVVGLFSAAVGIYIVIIAQKASTAMSTLKLLITDEKALMKAFQANDRNGDGVLERFEFDGLIHSMGIELDSDELDAAFSSIDTNYDKKIVYDEFRTWWKASTVDAENSLV